MNIIKEMLNLPDTPSGKKKLNKLITKLGLGKKQKGDILKNVVSGDIGGSNVNSDFKLKSRKVCWEVDSEKLTDETFNQLKVLLIEVLRSYPLYSSIHEEYDSTSTKYKYYGPFVNIPLCILLVENRDNWNAWYFEEAEDIENHFDGFMGYFKKLDPSITEEMVYEMLGLKRIPYEEYIALRIDKEQGKDYIN